MLLSLREGTCLTVAGLTLESNRRKALPPTSQSPRDYNLMNGLDMLITANHI